uniref:Fatty acyl-CoA reductase C-terminal domain-containing protein n=1 Tax=Photinus pyralis TaxID=7054 RepID=A0A1Y1ML12_PHOPY
MGTTWKVENPEVRIFNCVSSNQNPITWGRHRQLLQKYDSIIPASERFFNRFLIFSKSDMLLSLIQLFFLPVVYLMNRNVSFFGKQLSSVRLYKGLARYIQDGAFASGRPWLFKDVNTQALWSLLDKKDRKMFNFDIKTVDWDTFYYQMTCDMRRHVFNKNVCITEKAKC